MTRNSVAICRHWTFTKRRLYYDFDEKAFYRDRFDRQAKKWTSRDAFNVFILAPIGGRLLWFIFGLLYVPESPHMQPFATGAAIIFMTLVAYALNKIPTESVFINNIYVVDRVRVFSSELDAMNEKIRKRILQTSCVLAIIIAVFSIFVWRQVSSPDERGFAEMMIAWMIVSAVFFVLKPHQQLKFHRQLKRGEIWIDRTIE